jgi:hypothetical protein
LTSTRDAGGGALGRVSVAVAAVDDDFFKGAFFRFLYRLDRPAFEEDGGACDQSAPPERGGWVLKDFYGSKNVSG